jgi:hypothetical protein
MVADTERAETKPADFTKKKSKKPKNFNSS